MARGRRSGVTLLPSGLIGIPLACRIGSAIDGGESLRKSACLVNFGGVVFVPTSKFLLLLPLWTCWCKTIDVGRGVQGLRKNNGFSDLAHGLWPRRRRSSPLGRSPTMHSSNAAALGPVYTKTMWKRYGKFADSIRYDRIRTKRSAGVYTKTMQGRWKMPSLGPTTRHRASSVARQRLQNVTRCGLGHCAPQTLCDSTGVSKCIERTCITPLLIPFSSVEKFNLAWASLLSLSLSLSPVSHFIYPSVSLSLMRCA